MTHFSAVGCIDDGPTYAPQSLEDSAHRERDVERMQSRDATPDDAADRHTEQDSAGDKKVGLLDAASDDSDGRTPEDEGTDAGRHPTVGHSETVEIAQFGTNPGDLAMYVYVPNDLPAGAPLVVALHGCTQSATDYDDETGWTKYAERQGFALVFPETNDENNLNGTPSYRPLRRVMILDGVAPPRSCPADSS